MVHFLAMILLLEFRLAARLVALISSTWWWMLAPLWLLIAVTVITLAGMAMPQRLEPKRRRLGKSGGQRPVAARDRSRQ
jgi:fatty acid desaturase